MTKVTQLIALAWLIGLSTTHAADTNQPTATLLFTGMTAITTNQVAAFTITNGTSAHIACGPEAIEYRTNNVWKKISLRGNYRLTRHWTAVPEELHAGEAKSFAVPPPVTNANWRLIFTCFEQRPIVDTAYDAARRLTATNDVQKSTRQFSGHHYSITSPIVTNQPTAATH